MRGGEDGEWFEKGLVRLKDEKAGWKEVPQPAVRRALEVIAFDGRIWMVGGLTEDGDISNEAKSFDPKTQSWKDEASIPGISANGNGIAGCVSGNRLYMAGMDGMIYRLANDRSKWENAGKLPSRYPSSHGWLGTRNDLLWLEELPAPGISNSPTPSRLSN